MSDPTPTPAYVYPYKPGSYSSDEAAHVAAHLDGLQTFIFTYNGGKLKVWHDGPRLVYAQQTAKAKSWSVAQMWLTSRPENSLERRDRHKVGDDVYMTTYNMPAKYDSAFKLLFECWRVKAAPEHLYAAIGIKCHSCALCGRALTTPESTQRGVGPECIHKIWGKAAQEVVIELVAGLAAKNPDAIII